MHTITKAALQKTIAPPDEVKASPGAKGGIPGFMSQKTENSLAQAFM